MTLPPAPEFPSAHRAGAVAIVGRPNVGKSTLLNRLVGARVSITSSKPQTTRYRITGIVTRPTGQVVFIDTPGYQTQHQSMLNRAMNRSVTTGVQEANAILWLVEALAYDERDEAVARLLPAGVPVVLAVNKTDAVKEKDRLLPFIGQLSRRRDFAAIVPISAAKGIQLADLLNALQALLPEGPPLYGPDEITTANERFLAAEAIREKLFRLLGDELPYSATVDIDRFQEEGNLRRIHASITVDKEGQKPIVIGAGGGKLKAIASAARRDMEQLFGGKVFLEVRVRVRRGWANSAAALRRMGLDS
jgi:GTP-binding protein Era